MKTGQAEGVLQMKQRLRIYYTESQGCCDGLIASMGSKEQLTVSFAVLFVSKRRYIKRIIGLKLHIRNHLLGTYEAISFFYISRTYFVRMWS
jgi:hypothetical protein